MYAVHVRHEHMKRTLCDDSNTDYNQLYFLLLEQKVELHTIANSLNPFNLLCQQLNTVPTRQPHTFFQFLKRYLLITDQSWRPECVWLQHQRWKWESADTDCREKRLVVICIHISVDLAWGNRSLRLNNESALRCMGVFVLAPVFQAPGG